MTIASTVPHSGFRTSRAVRRARRNRREAILPMHPRRGKSARFFGLF